VCGICGVVALDGGRIERDDLEAMQAGLGHRGPDSAGVVVDGPAGLAARRLAIIDLEHGDQPVATEDGGVRLVQNGEIYNHAALRERLRGAGHTFASQGDTEVLAHLYEEDGERMLPELRGMFAIAGWEARRRSLLLARDRFGIKPLYWTQVGARLAFASELTALLRLPWVSREPDPDALEAFLALNVVPAPLTVMRGIRKLPPGHLLRAQDGAVRVQRWARPAPVAAEQVRTEPFETLAAELRDRLRDSVRAHLVADVPVGVLLSGGVDSSTLAALAAEASSHPVRTFSIGFRERSFDELDLARQVAQRYGTDHHELVLEPDAAELLPEVASAYDEPSGDSSALPTFLVSRLAAGHVKVALSGEGGDELLGGYETYVADLLRRRVGPLARLASPVIERLPSGSGRVPLDYKAKRFVRAAHLPPLEAHHGWKEIFPPEARAALRAGDGAVADPLAGLRARWAETEGAELLARLQDVDTGTNLVDDLLTKADRMSMHHSLELRVPFLDPAVAELALALPTAAKVRGTQKKRVLRAAAAPLVPEEIVRGRKRGFSIPAAAWLRGELVPFARDVLSAQRLRRQGFFDPAVVGRVLDDHVAGREDLSRQLWGLMSWTLWWEKHG
jgi:asparagine synthase (glutamine-hydrolysing)